MPHFMNANILGDLGRNIYAWLCAIVCYTCKGFIKVKVLWNFLEFVSYPWDS